MPITRHLSFVSGTLLTGIGIFLLSRLIVVERPPDNNMVGPVIVTILGVSFLLIGVSSLLRAYKARKINAVDIPSPEPDTRHEGGLLLGLGQLFKWLGHTVILISVVGTLWLVLFAETGGASGVPIGIGIFISLLFYGLGSLCKTLGR
jgi:hypothetical protein